MSVNETVDPKIVPPEESTTRRRRHLVLLILTVLIIALAYLIYWLLWAQFRQTTDDAYVEGNKVELTAQVNGIVTAIFTDDTYFIEEGKVVLQLDPTDFILDFEKSKAELAETVREVAQTFEEVKRLTVDVLAKQAELEKSAQDLENRKQLVGIGGVSKEDFEHVEANLKVAKANLAASVYELKASQALTNNTTVYTHPKVEKGKEAVKERYVALQRTRILAPVSGIVAQRSAQVGEWINAGKPLLAIIPLNQMWVTANFKENQLSHIRLGAPIEMYSDLYGSGTIFTGKVLGIGAGTGSQFSILPPQNATGNWIKIVQRLPVRVSLNSDQVKQFPLRLGLSMTVTVDTHNRSAKQLPQLRPNEPLYQTTAYVSEQEGVQEIIDKILKDNYQANE